VLGPATALSSSLWRRGCSVRVMDHLEQARSWWVWQVRRVYFSVSMSRIMRGMQKMRCGKGRLQKQKSRRLLETMYNDAAMRRTG
jgi:hypothetical protein